LPEPFWQHVLDLRTELGKDPVIGAIFDPPTVHCSHVLAEDFDWEGLEPALADFASRQKPFDLRTGGVLCFTGGNSTIVINVLKDQRLLEYHERLYEAASKFAVNLDPSYEPSRWIPHVTIKRCGPHADSFGNAMAKLASVSFHWTIRIDYVSAQHDLGGSTE
jgi:2'-5' RNA ligase